MKRFILFLALMAGAVVVAGCGGGGSDSATPAPEATSMYDAGPRAGDVPVDEALAEVGEGLFKTKTCSTCHAFGKRITGPDLQGVTKRRTEAWMTQQILHPDVMTKEDPISKGLLGTYAVQMPNLMLKPEEAKALIEYAKKEDRELGSATAEASH